MQTNTVRPSYVLYRKHTCAAADGKRKGRCLAEASLSSDACFRLSGSTKADTRWHGYSSKGKADYVQVQYVSRAPGSER